MILDSTPSKEIKKGNAAPSGAQKVIKKGRGPEDTQDQTTRKYIFF